MLEIADQLLLRLRTGQHLAIATSIAIQGSSPYPVGTSLAVADDGTILGQLSGGCVDTAAVAACRNVLAGAAAHADRYGIGRADSLAAGLACGGQLDVVVHPVVGTATIAELAAAAAGRPAAIAILTAGPPQLIGRAVHAGEGARLPGDLADVELTAASGLRLSRVHASVAAQAAAGMSGTVNLDCAGEAFGLFVDVRRAAPLIVLVGATEVARLLEPMAHALGYTVMVVDHRAAFACRTRGALTAAAHEILAQLPVDRSSVVCTLTHDEDLDPLAIAVALERGAGFVGALGSRATHARRLDRLRAFGVPETDLARLHAPVGLDLGATSAAETAISILAEVVAARTGGSGAPLSACEGPLHHSHVRHGRWPAPLG